ncbi:hypothetical protein GCM10027598_25910 [Amycolatopsis oliviviridis]|uniref:Uncharacterized protein n=1 Tax=Amycolatopsis oliviviridis TaxID=1471590 RepID=A0ABQ3LIP6_9PSEU|nr:hypothetical protein GCM10017790_33560 [Amycolatopsis oliviviridis]
MVASQSGAGACSILGDGEEAGGLELDGLEAVLVRGGGVVPAGCADPACSVGVPHCTLVNRTVTVPRMTVNHRFVVFGRPEFIGSFRSSSIPPSTVTPGAL